MRISRAPAVVLAFASLAGANPTTQTDFYYYGGTPVRLTRSQTECVVSFTSGAREDNRELVGEVSSSVSLGGEIRSEGRVFHIVTIPQARDGEQIARLIAMFQRTDGVEFAAPVFYDDTRTRLFPTGEIVVKLKPGDSQQHLTDVIGSRHMVILKMMPGTRDEYVLGLAGPKDRDPIRESRLLHDTGRFDWVHPNFVQEVVRRRD